MEERGLSPKGRSSVGAAKPEQWAWWEKEQKGSGRALVVGWWLPVTVVQEN